jgi:mono/diheme cytochrome c family protein
MVTLIVTAISMGVLTWKGATAPEAGAGSLAEVPKWMQEYNLPANAQPGAEIFAVSGCLNCHTYGGSGSPNLGAPDLTQEGTRNRGIQWQIDHLKCPSCVNPGSPMPPFEKLGEDNLRKIAIFLEASKGG